MDTHDLRRRLHFEIRNRNFTCLPCTRHARSPQRVALRNPKSQFHLHSAHSTRTISAEGCTSKSKNTISPAFRALDTHDLRKGLHFEIQKRNFTCIPRTRHARSPQRVHISKTCFRSTAPATKSWAEVIRNAALATQNHPQAQVPKMQPLSGTPANVLATSTKYCACHDFRNVSDSLHLPRKLTFLTSTCDGFLAPAMLEWTARLLVIYRVYVFYIRSYYLFIGFT